MTMTRSPTPSLSSAKHTPKSTSIDNYISNSDDNMYLEEIARLRKERDDALDRALRAERALQLFSQTQRELELRLKNAESERNTLTKLVTALEEGHNINQCFHEHSIETAEMLSRVEGCFGSVNENISRLTQWISQPDDDNIHGPPVSRYSNVEGVTLPSFAQLIPGVPQGTIGYPAVSPLYTPQELPRLRPVSKFPSVPRTGTPVMLPRTVSTTFVLDVKEEDDEDVPMPSSPVKRKRDDHQQATPRTTQEPATPLDKPDYDEAYSSDDELSLQRGVTSPRKTSRRTTSRVRRIAGRSGSVSRPANASRRNEVGDDDEYVVEEERPRGRTAGTPYPVVKKARK